MNHVAKDNNSQLKLDFVCCKIFHLRMATRLGNYLLDHVKKMTTIACFIYQPKLHQIVCLFLLINHVLMSFFFKKKLTPGQLTETPPLYQPPGNYSFLLLHSPPRLFSSAFALLRTSFCHCQTQRFCYRKKEKKASVSQTV